MGEEKKRGPKPRVSDEEILQVFRQSADPVLTASEVSTELPIKRRSVYDRLVQLEEVDTLESKKVGGRTTVWWLPNYTSTSTTDRD
ncbi:hypothetical protein SAMN04487967_0392 [Natronorubrum sediminis]|uniref:FaeA-like protein n=1 Tax=Natronorubrum sediminis TaxID=640943 RepID=A0A1H6FKZ7_9EURY|nr:hypothetical protein SAMN04487967_0392 [Natronorubrum sediminis]